MSGVPELDRININILVQLAEEVRTIDKQRNLAEG
jgi:hypothetical protein